MPLSASASYPQARSYVLKLHRDSDPSDGRFVGKLEHIATGHTFQFSSMEELAVCLAEANSLVEPDPSP